jgi:Flp pilus assembly pilin Flp
MLRHRNNKAQSTLEYAIIIAVVVGALLAIQVYVKRGVQGRFKQAADDIGEQFSAQQGTYTTTTCSAVTSNEVTAPKNAWGEVMSQTTSDVSQTQNVVSTANLEAYNAENWD